MLPEHLVEELAAVRHRQTGERGVAITLDLGLGLIQNSGANEAVTKAWERSLKAHLSPQSLVTVYRGDRGDRHDITKHSVGILGFLLDYPPIRTVYMFTDRDRDNSFWVGLFTPLAWQEAIKNAELSLGNMREIIPMSPLERVVDLFQTLRGKRRNWAEQIEGVVQRGVLEPIMLMQPDMATATVYVDRYSLAETRTSMSLIGPSTIVGEYLSKIAPDFQDPQVS
ncbi:hypothetical protein HYS93_01840 [Candidatus Daviesbacteria bacterium]|nr:hypothetical protein [Candidatus Daviesbacteria bacterium]